MKKITPFISNFMLHKHRYFSPHVEFEEFKKLHHNCVKETEATPYIEDIIKKIDDIFSNPLASENYEKINKENWDVWFTPLKI